MGSTSGLPSLAFGMRNFVPSMGSGQFGTPFWRMHCAYFTYWSPPVPAAAPPPAAPEPLPAAVPEPPDGSSDPPQPASDGRKITSAASGGARARFGFVVGMSGAPSRQGTGAGGPF
ncbi:hypothetical protein E1287_31340 [Actinomadura sp. KC06]|nr:hypothetical protein E1287_31340 [Actinomadura sp. KC06]